MQRQQITITMPQIPTPKYKAHAKQIEDLVKELNSFTNRLQDKVNNMLKGQQIQFVNSYKDHMHKVEQCLKGYQLKIEENHKKIEYYENEGVLSNLLKKISFLEGNQKQLLLKIQKKDRSIHVLKGEISTQQSQIASLEEKIRQLLLNQQTRSPPKQPEKHSQPTFATEIHSISKKTLKSNNSVQYLSKMNNQFLTISPVSDSGEQSMQVKGVQLQRFKRQLMSLKRKNRQLSSFNSKILDKASQVEQFFLKTVNDLKKKIAVRKKITACSFEDFKQEDKLELLIKVLSNQEILQHLYAKIFKKTTSLEAQLSRSTEKSPHSAMTDRVVSRLPAINSFRR